MFFVKSGSTKLKEIGIEILPDELQLIMVLGSLPREFEHFNKFKFKFGCHSTGYDSSYGQAKNRTSDIRHHYPCNKCKQKLKPFNFVNFKNLIFLTEIYCSDL